MKLNTNQTPWRNSLVLWLLIGGALAYIFYALFHNILMPFIVAIIIAYILKPIVESLATVKFSRALSATLLVGGFILIVIAASLFAIPLVKNELLSFSQKIPSQLKRLEETLTPHFSDVMSTLDQTTVAKIQTTLSDYFSDMLSWTLKLLAGLFTSSLAIANLISLIILTPIITFYVLRDWPKMEGFCSDLVPVKGRKTYQSLMSEIQQTLSAYFRGQATVCLVLVVYYVIALSAIGLDFAFILGFISGLLVFIPYVGFLIAFIAALGVSLAQVTSLKGALLVIAIYGVGHIIEAYYLTPKLVGDRIGLHPVWIIFALLAGGVVAGFSGILIAVPIAAIINVLLRFLFNLYRHSPAFLGRPLPSTPIESDGSTKRLKK
jgi:predicted PurR-regulated permease PerM